MSAHAGNALPFFRQPSFLGVVFSVKTYASAMLALWIAFYFDLSSPYWAMGTAYIVAHPLSGALTSKALYRLVGSLIGAVVTVALVPNLVNTPFLLTVAIAFWTAVCLVLSLYDRTPRSYIFMLAGYSTAIIAFPIVDTPDAAFDYSVARTLEICVGILSAAFVSRIFFPQDAAPVVGRNIDDWLTTASVLGMQALERHPDAADMVRTRRKLAADAIALRELTAQVGYDAGTGRRQLDALLALEMRMLEMLPLLSSIEDLVNAIEDADREDKVAAAHPVSQYALRRLREILAAWLDGDLEEMPTARRAECWRLMQLVSEAAGKSTYRYDILTLNLAQDILELIKIRNDCLSLRTKILSGSITDEKGYGFDVPPPFLVVHTDHTMAFLSGLAVFTATCLTVAFWIYSGWPYGWTAAMMASIFCCLFARMDDPAPMIFKQCVLFSFVFVLTFIINFALMPMLDGFVTLALIFAVILIPLGTLIANPKTAGLGAVICINIPYMLMIQSHAHLDLTEFANANFAMIFGVYVAAAVTMVIRSVGAEWAGRRLLEAGWRDIHNLADMRERTTRERVRLVVYRMIDRYGLLSPRLGMIASSSEVANADILRDLRVGMHTARLNHRREDLPRRERRAVARVLRALRTFYAEIEASTRPDRLQTLLRIIESALRVVSRGASSPTTRQARLSLIGLIYALRPIVHADAVRARTASSDTAVPIGKLAKEPA